MAIASCLLIHKLVAKLFFAKIQILGKRFLNKLLAVWDFQISSSLGQLFE